MGGKRPGRRPVVPGVLGALRESSQAGEREQERLDMVLVPIEGLGGHFRDTETGQIIDVRGHMVLDRTFPFKGRTLRDRVRLQSGDKWALKEWSILIHPWPKTISTQLTVQLKINYGILADVPLFAIAEPLARPEDEELRKRLDVIEKQLNIGKPKKPTGKLSNILLDAEYNPFLEAEVQGSHTVFTSLYEKVEVFELRLCGLMKEPINDGEGVR